MPDTPGLAPPPLTAGYEPVPTCPDCGAVMIPPYQHTDTCSTSAGLIVEQPQRLARSEPRPGAFDPFDPTLPTVVQALARVQASVGAVAKTGTQPKEGYRYRGIDGALNALHPALAEHGVIILPQLRELHVEAWPYYPTDAWRLYRVHVDFEFHGPSGDRLTVRVVGEGLDNGDKGVGKAMSYAYKTMAWQVFSIPTDSAEDTEAQALPEPEARTRQQARQRPARGAAEPPDGPGHGAGTEGQGGARRPAQAPWDGPRWARWAGKKGVTIEALRTATGDDSLTWDVIAGWDEDGRRDVHTLVTNWETEVDAFTGKPEPEPEPDTTEGDSNEGAKQEHPPTTSPDATADSTEGDPPVGEPDQAAADRRAEALARVASGLGGGAEAG